MPPLPPDPYKTLGVLSTAPVADIRTAYRKLVLTCHPDKVQDPSQKAEKLEEFQKLQHAYELLTDEKERAKYDEQVKLMEIRKEMSKNMANTSAPRTPRTYNVSIRTAEPRSSPYAQSPPQAGSRLYAQYSQPPREDSVFVDDAGLGRSSKRAPSDKRSSRKEKDHDEEKERERHRRRKEKEDEQKDREERERRSSDKEARKAEKRRQDKERRHAQEEKRRHTSSAYVEEYSGDGDAPKPEKKKSSSRKHRDRERERERESTPKVEVGSDKTTEKLSAAETYMYLKTRGVPPRPAAFDDNMKSSPPAAPTPPPQMDSPYTAPPVIQEDSDEDDEDEIVHRSRANARRGSYDPPRSKDRDRAFMMHKRSFPSVVDDPTRLSTSPSHLAAMATESPPRGSLPKHSTFHEGGHRTIPRTNFAPPVRSHTYTAGDSMDPRNPRGRSRSRYHSQVEPDLDEEEDEDEQRQYARSRRGSRRDTPTDPINIPRSHTYYGGEGRSMGRESFRSSYDRSKSYFPSSGSSGYAEYTQPRAVYPKVKTRKNFDTGDVAYGSFGGGSYQEPIDAYP